MRDSHFQLGGQASALGRNKELIRVRMDADCPDGGFKDLVSA
jgi:hypothetical protein